MPKTSDLIDNLFKIPTKEKEKKGEIPHYYLEQMKTDILKHNLPHHLQKNRKGCCSRLKKVRGQGRTAG